MVTDFAARLHKVNFKHETRDGKHDDVTSRNVTLLQKFTLFSGLKTKTSYKIRIMSEKVYNKHFIIDVIVT